MWFPFVNGPCRPSIGWLSVTIRDSRWVNAEQICLWCLGWVDYRNRVGTNEECGSPIIVNGKEQLASVRFPRVELGGAKNIVLSRLFIRTEPIDKLFNHRFVYAYCIKSHGGVLNLDG